MSEITIAVMNDTECGNSPRMPYIGERIPAEIFTRRAKLYLTAALSRSGFNAVDCNPRSDGDMQDFAMRSSRISADAAIVLSYAAFGSGRTFNDVSGFCVRLANGRAGKRAKTLGEDIFVALSCGGRCGTISACGDFFGSTCPAVTIDGGYVTSFDDARLIYDPEFALETAEAIARGICEFFGKTYIKRDDISAYPILCLARRDKNVKMLQCLLDTFGAELVPDGIYGAETDRAVRIFRQDNGHAASGAVDAAVWRDLLVAEPADFCVGSRCAAAVHLNSKLRSKLYDAELGYVFTAGSLDALNSFLADSVGADAVIARGGVVTSEVFKLTAAHRGARPRLF